MNKLISTSLLSTVLLMGAADSQAGFDGWNAGAFVGLSTSNSKASNYYTQTGVFDFTKDSDNINLGATYTQFGLKAGWGMLSDQTYWGVRVRGAFNQGEATYENNNFNAAIFGIANGTKMKMKLRRDWEWGIGALAGRLVAENVLFYGGVEFGMQYRTAVFDVTDNAFAFQFAAGGVDKKKFATPYATPLLGTAIMFADRFSVNVEAGYDVALNSKTIAHKNGNDHAQEKFKGMNGIRFTVGVTYHF